jgi:hypothetical protein
MFLDVGTYDKIKHKIKPRRLRWTRHVAPMGDIRSVYKILCEKHVRKRKLGRPNLIYENDMKLGLKGIGCENMYWFRIGFSDVPL